MALSKQALEFSSQMDAQVASVGRDFLSDNPPFVLEVVHQGTFKKTTWVVSDDDTESKFYFKHFSESKKKRDKKLRRDAEERFKYEIAVMKKLSHPSLLTEHVACNFEAHWFLLFDKNVDRSLSQVIEQDLLDDENHALTDKMFIQVACGVLYMHHKGVAHLKISPHNIFVDEFYNAKIANFETTQAVVHADNSLDSQAALQEEVCDKSSKKCMQVRPPTSRGSYLDAFTALEYLEDVVNAYKLDMHALGAVLYCMLHVVIYSTPQLFYVELMDGGLRYVPSRYEEILAGLTHHHAEERWNGKELREGIREWPQLEKLFQRYMHVKDSDLCLRE